MWTPFAAPTLNAGSPSLAALTSLGRISKYQIPVLNLGYPRGRRFALGSKAEPRSDSSQI